MLLSVYFEKLVSFEFGINSPHLLLLIDFLVVKIFVFENDVFVLPSPPDLILNLLFLFRSLFDSVDNNSFSSVDLD